MSFYIHPAHATWIDAARRDATVPELLDNAAKPLYEGDEVAFNLSGSVARGEIVSIPDGTRPFRRNIRVRLLHRAGGYPAGHISKIQNESGLLVL